MRWKHSGFLGGSRGALLPWQHKRVSQQLVSVRLRQRDRQQGRKGKGVTLSLNVLVSRKLTICGLHDVGVVVAAAGTASHRGYLGPLRMKRGALRQPCHIGGC